MHHLAEIKFLFDRSLWCGASDGSGAGGSNDVLERQRPHFELVCNIIDERGLRGRFEAKVTVRLHPTQTVGALRHEIIRQLHLLHVGCVAAEETLESFAILIQYSGKSTPLKDFTQTLDGAGISSNGAAVLVHRPDGDDVAASSDGVPCSLMPTPPPPPPTWLAARPAQPMPDPVGRVAHVPETAMDHILNSLGVRWYEGDATSVVWDFAIDQRRFARTPAERHQYVTARCGPASELRGVPAHVAATVAFACDLLLEKRICLVALGIETADGSWISSAVNRVARQTARIATYAKNNDPWADTTPRVLEVIGDGLDTWARNKILERQLWQLSGGTHKLSSGTQKRQRGGHAGISDRCVSRTVVVVEGIERS